MEWFENHFGARVAQEINLHLLCKTWQERAMRGNFGLITDENRAVTKGAPEVKEARQAEFCEPAAKLFGRGNHPGDLHPL